MKTERRHELQTNWLADRVGELLVVIRPYGKGLIGVALAAIVVWGAYLFLAHRAAAEEATGWNKLWAGLNRGSAGLDDLRTLADTSSARPTGEWALLVVADDNLTTGVGALFTEKAAGRNMIKTALDGYQTVLKNTTDPMVREHALYGVGRCQESLCDLDKAQAAYEQIVKDYPTSTYSPRATQRLDDLARDSTRARYDWFAKLEPPPSVFNKGTTKPPEAGGPQLSPELEPFSEFTKPTSKTPPPEPKPDKGATAPKEPTPKESKPGEAKSPDKSGSATTPAAKAPEKSNTGDKTGEAGPVIPKSTDSKASETKAPETKAPDTKAPPKSSDSK